MKNFSKDKPKQPSHIAYSVEDGKEGQKHWNKVGAMWPTKDGGFSLKVQSIPIDGNIALRSREDLEKMRAARNDKQENSKEMEFTQKP